MLVGSTCLFPGSGPDFTVPAVLNGIGLNAWIGRITIQNHPGEFTFQQLFDISQQLVLIHAYKGDGLTVIAGASGSTNTMYIVFRDVGEFIVHHMG